MTKARDITHAAGGDWRGDSGAIPTPGHSKRDRGTIVRDRDDGRGVVVHAFNADWRDVRRQLGLTNDAQPLSDEERRELARLRAKSQAAREAKQVQRCLNLIGESTAPASSGPVRAYLAARGMPAHVVAHAVAAGSLREHMDAGGRVSMLAIAHDACGRIRAVQLTKLKPDGSGKRGTDIDRLTYGSVRGASCRLLKPEAGVLAIAEGVETALAFRALRGVPCWAAFGASNLQAFTPPPDTRVLYIAADNDAPGRAAAVALIDRLSHSRLSERARFIVETPEQEGLDWLDILCRT